MKQLMKKCSFIFLLLFLVSSLCLPASAAIKLNKTKVTIGKGLSYTLKLSGTKKAVTWKSKNTKIAAVSKKGVVTGKKPGKTVITASVKGSDKKYKCSVTVKKNSYVGSATPGSVRVSGTGINLFIKSLYYSGKQLVCKGFFTNRTGQTVTRLSSYRITLTDGNGEMIAGGTFNMNVNIPNKGYQYTTLIFSGSAVASLKLPLYKIKSIQVQEAGYYSY